MTEIFALLIMIAPVPGFMQPTACRNDGDLIVDDQDCNKFYKCTEGIPTSLSCPAGLRFNPRVKVCDWPDAVPCNRSRLSSFSSPSKPSDADVHDTENVQTRIRVRLIPSSFPVSSRVTSQKIAQSRGAHSRNVPAKSILVGRGEKARGTSECPSPITNTYCDLCCNLQVFGDSNSYELALQNCYHVNHPAHCNVCCPGLHN